MDGDLADPIVSLNSDRPYKSFPPLYQVPTRTRETVWEIWSSSTSNVLPQESIGCPFRKGCVLRYEMTSFDPTKQCFGSRREWKRKRQRTRNKSIFRQLRSIKEHCVATLALDACAASVAAALVAPFISVIDVAVVENASGLRKLGQGIVHHGMKVITSPSRFFTSREFHTVWAMYAATYAAANWVDTYSHHKHKDAHLAKFASTTLVNMKLGIAKDHAYTQMFSVIAPHPFPLQCYVLFALRDCITMGASFSWTDDMSLVLQEKLCLDKDKADLASQLGCPSLSQLLTTPLHLLAVDMYNRPAATATSRILFVGKEYVGSTLARIGRVGTAFGIGGVANRVLVKGLQSL